MAFELVFASALGVVYFLSRLFYRNVERHHYYLMSFGSGLLLGIIFLQIFPEIVRAYIFMGGTYFCFSLPASQSTTCLRSISTYT